MGMTIPFRWMTKRNVLRDYHVILIDYHDLYAAIRNAAPIQPGPRISVLSILLSAVPEDS
jgi:hypothetical protein